MYSVSKRRKDSGISGYNYVSAKSRKQISCSAQKARLFSNPMGRAMMLLAARRCMQVDGSFSCTCEPSPLHGIILQAKIAFLLVRFTASLCCLFGNLKKIIIHISKSMRLILSCFLIDLKVEMSLLLEKLVENVTKCCCALRVEYDDILYIHKNTPQSPYLRRSTTTRLHKFSRELSGHSRYSSSSMPDSLSFLLCGRRNSCISLQAATLSNMRKFCD